RVKRPSSVAPLPAAPPAKPKTVGPDGTTVRAGKPAGPPAPEVPPPPPTDAGSRSADLPDSLDSRPDTERIPGSVLAKVPAAAPAPSVLPAVSRATWRDPKTGKLPPANKPVRPWLPVAAVGAGLTVIALAVVLVLLLRPGPGGGGSNGQSTGPGGGQAPPPPPPPDQPFLPARFP